MKNLLTHYYFKLIFLILLIICLGVSFYHYNEQNEIKIMGNLQGITEESNQQINHVVSDKLKNDIHLLEVYANILAKEEDLISDASFQDLAQLMNNDSFLRVAITDANGISYTSDQVQHDSSDREYYKEAMKGKPYISDVIISSIDQNQVVVISVPIIKEEQVIGVLRATYNINNLYHYFDLSYLKVTSFIIQRDGLNLTLEENGTNTNFFTMLEEDERNAAAHQTMQQDLQKGSTGNITFYLNQKARFAYYSPIEGCNWYALTILPFSMVEQQLAIDLKQTLMLAGIVICVLSLGGVYVLYLQYLNAQKIKENNKMLDALISNTPGTLYKHEVNHIPSITFYSLKKPLYLGYTKEEIQTMITHNLFELIFEEDYQTLQRTIKDLQENETITSTYRVIDKEKHVHWFFDQRHIIQEDGKQVYYVSVLDITEMKATQELLKVSEARYRLILHEAQSVIFEWNISEDVIEFSDLWASTYGYPTLIHDFMVVTCERYEGKEHSYVPLLEAMISGKSSDQIECILEKKDGTEVWVKIIAKAIYDDQGYLLRIVGSISDINAEKKRNMQLLEWAQKDGLTNVYNRKTVESMIQKEIKAFPESYHALFVIDIDDFKRINDTLGHASGDEALEKISFAMKSSFRSNDLIGRIGGDEFVIFMKHMYTLNLDQIIKKAEQLLEALQEIRLDEDAGYRVFCSIGIAIYPIDGTNYLELFKKADERLYQAKKQGKNSFVYDEKSEI